MTRAIANSYFHFCINWSQSNGTKPWADRGFSSAQFFLCSGTIYCILSFRPTRSNLSYLNNDILQKIQKNLGPVLVPLRVRETIYKYPYGSQPKINLLLYLLHFYYFSSSSLFKTINRLIGRKLEYESEIFLIGINIDNFKMDRFLLQKVGFTLTKENN